MIDKVTITVDLPAGFPEKYRFALVKAVDHCTVKAHILPAAAVRDRHPPLAGGSVTASAAARDSRIPSSGRRASISTTFASTGERSPSRLA